MKSCLCHLIDRPCYNFFITGIEEIGHIPGEEPLIDRKDDILPATGTGMRRFSWLSLVLQVFLSMSSCSFH